MSSRDSSTSTWGSRGSSVILQDTFRSPMADGSKGTRTDRVTYDAGRESVTTTWNHKARIAEEGAPTPDYSQKSHAQKYGN